MDYGTNFRSPRVDVHSFSMVPRADIPRSSFRMEHQFKATFQCSSLIPIYVQEILPGDSFNVDVTVFARLATPVYPILDNIDLETFFFFVPNRLTWKHWPNFMGEQNSPGDSITYSIPQIVSPVGGFAQHSIYDYFGLPTVGQVGGGNTISVNALPFRAYNLIVQEWFRDQNLDNALQTGTAGALTAGNKWICQSDDGPDPQANYSTFTVRKRHDYFTSALPWTQKGNTAITLPLGTSAPIKTQATDTVSAQTSALTFKDITTGASPAAARLLQVVAGGAVGYNATVGAGQTAVYPSNLYADLSAATAATINSIRLAFQTQRLLERDARGGTRYVESILSHFGVRSPDYRLMRPEYLGGGVTPITIAPVPQTTATGLTGGTSPIGTLSGTGMFHARHGWKQAFTEHGYVIGLCTVRNNKIYQQGIRKLWSRSTRYDFYLPVFAQLGEQPVLYKEIYADGSANDILTFGFQERWAEYRFHPSRTASYFRSTTTTPLDAWHTGQRFTALPQLNATFMQDDLGTTMQRVLAAGASANNQQVLADMFFREICARPMPMYSVPGLVDHF